jgi:hypothetical protein
MVNKYISDLNSVLLSKRTMYSIIFIWVLNTSYIIFFIPQASDDTYYFFGALGFLHEQNVGMLEGDIFSPTYFQFPGFSLFNGIFLYITSFFLMPINYYTYRLFHSILILLIMLLGVLLFHLHSNRYKLNNYVMVTCIYLIILILSPFSLSTSHVIRPESLGIVFILLALVIHAKWENSEFASTRINFCGLIFGLATITHPLFILISGAACLFIFVREIHKQHYYGALIFGIISIMPFIIYYCWLLYGSPDSFDQLELKSNLLIVAPHVLLKHNIEYFLINSSLNTSHGLSVKIYYLIYFAPLFIMTIISIYYLCKEYKIINKTFYEKITIYMYSASLLMFFTFKMNNYHFSVFAFITALYLSNKLANAITDRIDRIKRHSN